MENTTNSILVELNASKDASLKEAKKQYEEEKAKAEVEYAKKQIRLATDEIDYFDREIKKLQDKKKPFVEILKVFK